MKMEPNCSGFVLRLMEHFSSGLGGNFSVRRTGIRGSALLPAVVMGGLLIGNVMPGVAQTTESREMILERLQNSAVSSTMRHYGIMPGNQPYRTERLLEFMNPKVTTDDSYVSVMQSTGTLPGKFGCDFDGRVAPVRVKNDSLYPVNVYLVHPDSGTRWPTKDSYWTIDGQQSAFLRTSSSPLGFGSDWKIQIGGAEPRCIGSVSKWESTNRFFLVSTDQYFND